MVSEESENSDCFDDAEAVSSLLSEQVSEECFGGRVRSGFSFESVEVNKRGRKLSSSKRVDVEQGGNFDVRGRKVSLSKRVIVDKGGRNCGGERNVTSSSERVVVDKGGSISGGDRNVTSSRRVE